MVSPTLTVKDAAGNEVVSFADCADATVELTVGKYNFTYEAVVNQALAQNKASPPKRPFPLRLITCWFGPKMHLPVLQVT